MVHLTCLSWGKPPTFATHTDKIAIPDGVHAVFRDLVEAELRGQGSAIDRERISRYRAAAERHDVHAFTHLQQPFEILFRIPGVAARFEENDNKHGKRRKSVISLNDKMHRLP